jgi:hypothetical protein
MSDNTVYNDNDDSGVIIIDDAIIDMNRSECIEVESGDDVVVKNKIDIIMGQTEYGAEEARKLLVQMNGDEIAVIRLYLGLLPPTSPNTNVAATKSKNQLIYQEIRNFMDGCKENNAAYNK